MKHGGPPNADMGLQMSVNTGCVNKQPYHILALTQQYAS